LNRVRFILKNGRLYFFLLYSFFLLAPYGQAGQTDKPGRWLKSHWAHPIPPQGKAPKSFGDIEASLLPGDCGACHEAQYEAWKTSRHAHAMGPGIKGQFHSPWLDIYGRNSCRNCHSPLYEQRPYRPSDESPNPLYEKKLSATGVSCPVCHVRKHVRYGPPPRKPKQPDSPHNGFVVRKDFNRAEFCKPCHQFNPEDRRVNGKLIEDTYEQWKRSPAGKAGKPCASCHMPDREHSFKGIHSKEMVQKALTVKVRKSSDAVTVFVTNTGAGHKVPTYVTPKIAILGRVVTADGRIKPETALEYYIQWNVPLNLGEEYFDTRLDPGQTFKARFELPKNLSGNFLQIEIRVYPDDFYERFFASLLANSIEGVDPEKIREAHEDSLKSDFSIFSRLIAF